MSKRTTRILAVLAAVSVLTAVVALAISSASAEQQSWTTPVRIDNGSPLTSVSCVAALFCAAVDSSGDALTYNGSSWSAPASIGATSLTSVSCVSALFCAAVDSSGDALTYNGSSWSTPVPIDNGSYSGNGLDSVSCASASFCVAVDGSGNALTYNGSSWSAPDSTDSREDLSSVSCTSASFCVAVGTIESGGGSYGGYAVTYNGSSWGTPASIGNNAYPSSVSCTSASFCVAVGTIESGGGSYGGYAVTYNGSSWSTPASIGNNAYPSSVSCTSASFCIAVGHEENGSGGNTTTTGASSYEGYAVTYDGSSWGAPSNIDGDSYPSSVSCVSVSSCVAVDGSGNALTYLGNPGGPGTSIPVPSTGASNTSSSCSGASVSNPPRSVVILITGIASSLPNPASYNPLTQHYCGLASPGASSGQLSDLAFMAQNSFDKTSNGPISPVDLTDALASTGAVLLPYSYAGVWLGGTTASPLYKAARFGNEAPGAVSPAAEADSYLLQLVHQAHKLWPSTPIFVIGHSEGGLVAEQLFENNTLNLLEGVAGIVSLDSPLNGVAHNLGWFGSRANIVSALHIGPALFNLWNERWEQRALLDPRLFIRDRHMGDIYHPIGTASDLIYALGDLRIGDPYCGSLASQLIWNIVPCEGNGVPGFVSPESMITPEPATTGTPQMPGQGLFQSHEFVMQSADNIGYLIAQTLNAAPRNASISSIRQKLSDIVQPLASSADAGSGVAYSPRLVAGLGRPVAVTGGTITIRGTGLGSSPGTAEILSGGSTVSLPVAQWTADSITLQVPAQATSGVVLLTTAAGGRVIAGVVGVTSSRNNNVRLVKHMGSHQAFNGEPATVVIRALDAHKRPVRRADVQILLGSESLSTVANAHGLASFHIKGFGCQSAIAFSGTASTPLRICWHKLPHQSMVLTAHRRHRYTVVSATVRAHISGEIVQFYTDAGSCARLNRTRATADKRGTVTVQLTNRCGIPVLVEATTNHNTLTRGILVAS
jgi:hypothetical protein